MRAVLKLRTPDEAAHLAAPGDLSLPRKPTERQASAGNYAMGHTSVAGIPISIENPAGSRRRPEWPPLSAHYGYAKRTEGADGDHVDVFVRPGTLPDWQGDVYVIDQVDPAGQFDEHKAMVGWTDQASAERDYMANFTPGWRLGNVTPMAVEEFKAWLRSGDTTRPVAKFNPYHGDGGRFSTGDGASLEVDMPKQVEWLDTKAKAFGFKSFEDMLERAPVAADRMMAVWRQSHTVKITLAGLRKGTGGRPMAHDKIQKDGGAGAAPGGAAPATTSTGWQQSKSPTSGITAYGNTGKKKRKGRVVRLIPGASLLRLLKGDQPGHPFHGNQFTDGGGSGAHESDQDRSERQFRENYQRVQQNIETASDRQIELAIQYASRVAITQQPKAWAGDADAKRVMSAMFAEADSLKFALRMRREGNAAAKVDLGSLRKYSEDQDRDERGRFASGTSHAGDEEGARAPAPGEKFVVFRLGSGKSGSLEGKNAGNAHAVALHAMRAEGDEGPAGKAGAGNVITAHEVTIGRKFGNYTAFTAGQGEGAGKAVGRTVVRGNEVAYSFPKGADFTSKQIGSVAVKDLHAALRRAGMGRNFDEAGSAAGAQAIRNAFKVGAKKFERFDDAQPRDERGRWSAGTSTAALFSDNLGFSRASMPQVPDRFKAQFTSELAAKGVKSTEETVSAGSLKATQAEFNPENVAYLKSKLQAGIYDKANRLVVSREGRVLDGHHRWAAAAQLGQTLDVLRVDLPIADLMHEAAAFNERNGITSRAVTDTTHKMIEALLRKGDVVGHPFHGNQWTGGQGEGGGGAIGPEASAAPPGAGQRQPAAIATPSQQPLAVLNPEHLARLGPEAAVHLQSMYRTASAEKSAFDSRLNKIADEIGGKAILPPLKGSDRATQKIVDDYAGDASQIKDLLRATIEVNSVEAAQLTVDKLRQQFDVQAAGFRNTLDPSANPPDGYRDAKLNVRVGGRGGIMAEIQVNIPAMLAAKDALHTVYEERRTIAGNAYRENRPFNADEKTKIDALDATMKAGYDAAWRKVLGGGP